MENRATAPIVFRQAVPKYKTCVRQRRLAENHHEGHEEHEEGIWRPYQFDNIRRKVGVKRFVLLFLRALRVLRGREMVCPFSALPSQGNFNFFPIKPGAALGDELAPG